MPQTNIRKVTWRARRLIDKEFIYGQIVVFDHQGWIYENPDLKTEIDISTKGESIGVNDKNGNPIYEGDLIISTDDRGGYAMYVVVHRGCGFKGKLYDGEEYIDLLTHGVEVVGLYYSSSIERDLQDIKKRLGELIKGGGDEEK